MSERKDCPNSDDGRHIFEFSEDVVRRHPVPEEGFEWRFKESVYKCRVCGTQTAVNPRPDPDRHPIKEVAT